eukprot:CCRYP_018449-RA/>CCRYP_018449-RA protein AED:0.00 eAED:0.00 QI:287/1/1/1/0/0/2/0/86
MTFVLSTLFPSLAPLFCFHALRNKFSKFTKVLSVGRRSKTSSNAVWHNMPRANAGVVGGSGDSLRIAMKKNACGQLRKSSRDVGDR